VSIPRSGHHYLASLLQAVLGDDLAYCEFYSVHDCCRSVPCSVGKAARFTYQKGHDLDLTLPVDLPGVLYLVQYRDPVAEAVSDRELFLSATGFTTPPSADQYSHWLAGKTLYYAGFFAKWLRRPLPTVLAIDYERLVGHPVEVLEEVCRRIGAVRSQDAIQEAATREARVLRRPPIAPGGESRPMDGFVPRRVEASPCYQPEMLAEFEAAVLERVPELSSKRRLPRPDGPPSALLTLVESAELVAIGDHAGAGRRLAEGLARCPVNAYLHLAAGRLAAAAGAAAAPEARAAFERAAELSPSDPEILFLLADSCRSAGETELAVGIGRRIVAELPSSTEHRLFFAVLLSEAGQDEEALREVSHARQLGITDPHHHELVRQVSERAARRLR